MSDIQTQAQGEPLFTLVRDFAAPRELVFACWTEPAHFMQWWGPATFTTPQCSIDLRIGGRKHFCMRSPEGQEFWCGGVYREIQPPERLVTTFYFADAEGNPLPPAHYNMPAGWPDETIATVSFEEHNGGTRLTLSQNIPLALAKLVMADQGWGSSFDKLAAYMEKLG